MGSCGLWATFRKGTSIHNGDDDIEGHIPWLLGVALRITGDRNSAEEVVQDVCVRVLAQPNGFDGRSRFSTWLHRVTVNRSLDLVRKRKRENRQQVDLEGELDGLLTRQAMRPEETAERNELYQLARLLINRLLDRFPGLCLTRMRCCWDLRSPPMSRGVP